MIDWTRVDELRDEIGTDCFDEVVELFIEEVETEIDQLRSGTDPDQLEARLHFLKGSALSLGFEAFSKLCQEGETNAAQGRATHVDLSAILSCYDASKSAFLEKLAR